MTPLEQIHRRLEQLFEISKILASFESVEQTFRTALGLVAKTLPLRGGILIEAVGGGSRMTVWPSECQEKELQRAAQKNVEAAYRALVGVTSPSSFDGTTQPGLTAPRRQDGAEAKRFIFIALVVANRPPFGALHLEAVEAPDQADLLFVNAIANQFAIAFDRDRAWRKDITRREHAEKGQTDAEARGAAAELNRISAEGLSEKYQALARENARLYAEAQQSVRMREQLLSIVSHDLRTPLGTILMTADALARRGILPQAVGRIQRAATRMQRLIEDLLDFGTINAGQLAIRRQPEDAEAMIQETLASFEGVAQEKGLQLTAEVEPHLPKVFGDFDRLMQVFANLVGNATKVTAEGGKITLRADARGHEILFAVADSGPGVSEEDLKHLFERYWRSEEAGYKGTGLGLAIASGIVSAHGGRIWAESELGRGATFLFAIPTADLTALFTAPSPDAASSSTGF